MVDDQKNIQVSELKTELNRMVELFENTKINYQILDANLKITYVNKPWLTTLGYKIEDVTSQPFLNFVADKSVGLYNHYVKKIIEGKCSEDIELSLKCKEGSEIEACFSCFSNFDTKGNLLVIHAVFQNITKLRKTEEALRTSEDKYERIFNSISDVYYQTDENSIITVVSPSVTKLGGYKPKDIIGKSVSVFFNDESDRERFRELFLKQGYVSDYDLKLIKKDGTNIDVSLNAHLIKNELNNPNGVEGVIRDISRRKDDEIKLKEREILYKTLAENSPDVIMRFDRNLKHIFVNGSVQQYVDLKPADFIGKNHRELGFPPDKCRFWENSLKEVFSSGVKKMFVFSLNKDDMAFNFEWILVPEFGPGKSVETILAITRDISEREKFKTDLDLSNQRIKEITESLSVIFFQLNQLKNKFHISYITPNVTDRIGLSSKSIKTDLGQILKMISPEDKKRIKNELLSALKNRHETSFEYQIFLKGSTQKWFRIKATPQIIGQGEVIWNGISWDVTAEVNMRNKILEQADRLRELYTFTNVGIASMSTRGIITSVSPSISKVTGYSEKELVGYHFKDVEIFPKKDLRFYKNLFLNALNGKLPDEKIVYEWKHKNGEKRWGDAYLSSIINNGKLQGFQGIFMDATLRILHEEAESNKQENIKFLFKSAVRFLQIDSEDKFFRILGEDMEKLVPDAIININSINDDLTQLRVESIKGLKGNIQKTVFGLLENNIVGRLVPIDKKSFLFAKYGKLIKVHDNLYDMTFHTVPERICRKIEKLIQLKEILEISIGVGTKIMGSCVIFIRNGYMLKNSSLIETYFRQATQSLIRIRAIDQLKKKEVLYRSLAENTKELILRVDPDLKAIYANQAFLNTYQINPEIFYETHFDDLGLPYLISELITSGIEEAVRTSKLQTCTTVININNIQYFHEWHIYPEKESPKKVSSVLLVVRDITDRKVLETKVRDSIDLKNKMYCLIGHDLRSPFSGIASTLDLLIHDTKLTDETRHEFLTYAFESSQKFNNLLNSLLEWSHEFEKEGNVKPVFFDLAQMFENIIGLFKIQINEKNLSVYNSIPLKTIVRADYNMLSAAFRNFISNACKFSNKNGRIEILYEENKVEISITIQDFGIGMSGEEIKNLSRNELGFSKPGTLQEQGNGLGFAFAKEMISLNKGTVLIKSQKGKGSAITVKLKKGTEL